MDTSIESTTDPSNCTAKIDQQSKGCTTKKSRIYITATRPSAHTTATANPKDITDGNTTKGGATSKGVTTGNATAFPRLTAQHIRKDNKEDAPAHHIRSKQAHMKSII